MYHEHPTSTSRAFLESPVSTSKPPHEYAVSTRRVWVDGLPQFMRRRSSTPGYSEGYSRGTLSTHGLRAGGAEPLVRAGRAARGHADEAVRPEATSGAAAYIYTHMYMDMDVCISL